jgi:hypothetical protein
MTTATHPFRWRRILVLCAASVLLHYAVLDWGAEPAQMAAAPRVTIVAELRSAPPAPADLRPAPEAGAPVPLPLVQLPGPKRGKPARPPYRASMPPPARLTFDVARSGADGNGEALIDWRHANGQYRLAMRTAVDGSTLLELISEGAVGAGGIVPRTMSAQRRGKARTATHFGAGDAGITFSASEGSVPMAPGTQDKVSVLMQLAGIARANARQLDAGVALLVGAEKDAAVMRFVAVGQEEIETRMGKLATWHLLCEPAPGSYRPRLEVWLAPGHEWFPVQLRSTDASGVVTTQTVVQIDVNDAGSGYAK